MKKRIYRMEGKSRRIAGFVVMLGGHFGGGRNEKPRPILLAKSLPDARHGKGIKLGGSLVPLIGFALLPLDPRGNHKRRGCWVFGMFTATSYRLGGDDALRELQETGTYYADPKPGAAVPVVHLAAA